MIGLREGKLLMVLIYFSILPALWAGEVRSIPRARRGSVKSAPQRILSARVPTGLKFTTEDGFMVIRGTGSKTIKLSVSDSVRLGTRIVSKHRSKEGKTVDGTVEESGFGDLDDYEDNWRLGGFQATDYSSFEYTFIIEETSKPSASGECRILWSRTFKVKAPSPPRGQTKGQREVLALSLRILDATPSTGVSAVPFLDAIFEKWQPVGKFAKDLRNLIGRPEVELPSRLEYYCSNIPEPTGIRYLISLDRGRITAVIKEEFSRPLRHYDDPPPAPDASLYEADVLALAHKVVTIKDSDPAPFMDEMLEKWQPIGKPMEDLEHLIGPPNVVANTKREYDVSCCTLTITASTRYQFQVDGEHITAFTKERIF